MKTPNLCLISILSQLKGCDKDFLTASEVSKLLKMTPRKVCLSILNGSMPIGAVTQPTADGEEWTCKVVKTRLIKWLQGEL